MAHNLFYNEQTDKVSFFSVKEKTWHGLGQIVEDCSTSAEAIRYAGLDYMVENTTLNAVMRNHSGGIKIRHTASANDRLKQAHTLMGISHVLAQELAELFNNWSNVRITDVQVKKLIQVAMAPNKEVIQNLELGLVDKLSTTYTNIVDNAFAYAMGDPTQQMETTPGTLFGA